MTINAQNKNNSTVEMKSYFNRELQEAKTNGDKVKLGQIHNQFGQALFANEQYAEGEQQLNEAIILAKELKDRRLEAYHIGTKGSMLLKAKQIDECYLCFEEVYQIATEIGDHSLESNALGSMGMVYLDTGDPALALEKFKAALHIAQDNQDRQREMNSLSGLGNTYLNIAAEEEAIRYFTQALEIAKELDDKAAQAGFLNNLATIQKNARNYNKASVLFEEVRSLAQVVGDTLGERNALRHLIAVYSETNTKSDLVLLYLDRAITLSKQLDDYQDESSYQDAKILVLLNLNRHSEALDIIDSALQDERLSQTPERKMQLLVNQGNGLFDNNHLDQAYQSYQQALDIAVRRQNWNVEARVLGRIGAIEAERGRVESAVYYAEQSLQKATKLEDRRLIAEQHCMLAMAHRDLGNKSKAIEYCEQAIAIFDEKAISLLKEKTLLLLADLQAD
jgi:tetratricopeptide (TPR) repeat protein